MSKAAPLFSLAAALAALSSPAEAVTPPPDKGSNTASEADANASPKVSANAFYQVGNELMGMIITEKADGTIVAGHSSHASHSSHSSHSSSRF